MKRSGFVVVFFILLASALIYFFLGERYDMPILSKAIISLTAFIVFLFAYRRSLYTLSLAALSGFFIFISLVISLGKSYVSDSPISTSLVLGPWAIFAITLASTLIIIFAYEKMKFKDKYAIMLLVLFIAIWLILAINPKYYEDWKLENYLNVPFIIFLLVISRWFKFSNLSYFSIFIFMALNVIGSHYTYAEVPFGYWLANLFGVARNHYDRIVHFSFGLLFAYPIREIAMRIGKLKGFWSYYFPIDFVLALSVIYELIEWGVVIFFQSDLGIAYLGLQGDVWDAQKDMALAGLGSLTTMIIVAIVIIAVDARSFKSDFKKSLIINRDDTLGEKALSAMLSKRNAIK